LDSMGVKQVFHAGDLTDGTNVFRGQMYEQDAWGFDSQVDYTAKHYPRKKRITTYWVEGNHDSIYWQQLDSDIGPAIEARRPDLQCLGTYYARLKDGRFKVDLVHLRKSRAYAASYPAQVFLRDTLQPNYRPFPQLLGLGHRHRSWIGQLQSVWSVESGHFQKPTPYATERGLFSPRGGWILDLERDGAKIRKMKAEFIQTG